MLPHLPLHQCLVVSTAAKHSAQGAVSALCSRVGCALVPLDCCAVVPGVGRPIVSSRRSLKSWNFHDVFGQILPSKFALGGVIGSSK